MKIKHLIQFNCRLPATALAIMAIFLPVIVQGQGQDSLIDISRIKFSMPLKGKAEWERTVQDSVSDRSIPKLAFLQQLPASHSGKLLLQAVEKDIFLKFALVNSADTPGKICFYPGHFASTFRLFTASPNNIAATFHELGDTARSAAGFSNYFTIAMQPHQNLVCFARLHFARTDINIFMPNLVEPNSVRNFDVVMGHSNAGLDMVTYILSGLLLMMILYSLAVYLQNRGSEFLYYAGYALSTATLLFLISFLGYRPSAFNIFYSEYLDLIILCTGVICYLTFMRRFLNTRENHPFLERVLHIGRIIIIAMMVAFSLIYFLTDRFLILNQIENTIKQVMLIMSGIFIVYGLRKKDTLMRYLVAGNASLFVFSIVSFLVQQNILFENLMGSGILRRSLLYYETGLLTELTFFLSGLAYKNRMDIGERARERERLKLDNERKEFEKQMAVMAAQQDERDRISADMHDELGSGVTAIRLMSEIVKSKMKQQSLPEIEKISNSANDLLGKMNTIIWTMKSSNDTLESLVAYIRAHAIEFFDNTAVDCVVHVPEQVPASIMSGEKRRNIFLSIKESLNNIVKHSHAAAVIIDVITTDDRLLIKVHDDGIGIDTGKLRRFGNGLSNMRRRMETIDGEFKVESNGKGTTLLFEAPL